jgi:hypothetical protein
MVLVAQLQQTLVAVVAEVDSVAQVAPAVLVLTEAEITMVLLELLILVAAAAVVLILTQLQQVVVQAVRELLLLDTLVLHKKQLVEM